MTLTYAELCDEERENKKARRREWLAEISAAQPVIAHAATTAGMAREHLSRVCSEVGFDWPYARKGEPAAGGRKKVALRVPRAEAERLARIARGT